MSSKRVFSEQEAAEIMRRAVRLQETSGSGDDYTPGITMEEMSRIAEEAGIDLEFLRKATTGIDSDTESAKGVFSLTEEFERVVEGEMNPEDFDKVLKLVKPGHQRGISQVGRTLTGTGHVGPHMVHLNIESRNDRTRVNVKYSPLYAYLMGLHAPFIGAVISLGSFAEAGRPLVGAALATGLLLVGGGVFRYLVRAGRKAAKKLTGDIVDVIEEEIEPLRGNLETNSSDSSPDERIKER